jgi:hypothetical protein
MFRWGIYGTGAISAKFVAGLRSLPGAVASIVVSRDSARATRFAAAHGIAEAAQGYDPATMVGRVDAVYIATPNGLHATHAIACLKAGLPVLIEKPFAATASEAKAIVEAAAATGSFVMEGLWTRFLPAALAFAQRIEDGAIGTPKMMVGGFAIANIFDPTRPLFQLNMAGGALRQYGIYPLAFGQMVCGRALSVSVCGNRARSGVDSTVAMVVQYENGVVGNYHASLETTGMNSFAAYGDSGRLSLTGPIYRPSGLRYTRFAPRAAENGDGEGLASRLRTSAIGNRLVQILQHRERLTGQAKAIPYSGNGYNYEAAEAMRCIVAGERQSPMMPVSDSVELATLIDASHSQLEELIT